MRAINLIALTAWLTLTGTACFAEDLIPWVRDLETAKELASRENRLVLIHFYADDCPPCRRLEQNVFPRPEVARAISDNFIPVKVHAQRRTDIARRYGVDRWPTDVIITPAGHKLTSTVSPQDPAKYIALVNRVAASSSNRAMDPRGRYAASRQNSVSRDSRYQPIAVETGYANYQQPAGSGQQLANQASRHALQPPAAQPEGAARYGSVQHNNFTAANGALSGVAQQPNQPQQTSGYANYNGYNGASPVAANPTLPPNSPTQNSYAANQPPSRYGNPNRFAGAPQPSPQRNPAVPNGSNNRYQAQAGQYDRSQGQYDRSQGQGFEARQANERYSMPPASNPGLNPSYSGLDPTSPAQMYNQFAGQSPSTTPPAMPAQSPAFQQPLGRPLTAAPGAAQQVAQHPPVAMAGFCPVDLVENQHWTKGDPRWGAIHEGRTYLFSGQPQQQRFLATPYVFSPVLSGYDAVRYAETGQLVEGQRKHGVFYQNRVFLFADEGALERFWQSPAAYAKSADEAIQQAQLDGQRR